MSLLRKAFSRLHYSVDIIAQCVRWYLAYALSLRNLEDMMAERGIIRLVPLLDKAFRRHKRPVGRRWRMDETYSVPGVQGGHGRSNEPRVCLKY